MWSTLPNPHNLNGTNSNSPLPPSSRFSFTNKFISTLHSRYYSQVCNGWRGLSSRLSAWVHTTQLRRNIAALARCCDIVFNLSSRESNPDFVFSDVLNHNDNRQHHPEIKLSRARIKFICPIFHRERSQLFEAQLSNKQKLCTHL